MTDRTVSTEANELYRSVLLDDDLLSLRTAFCRTVTTQLSSIASWVAVDSVLEGGDMTTAAGAETTADPDRHAMFRGASAVIEMAAELATGAVLLLDGGHRYASAALIRQLIEAEYLLRAFVEDITRAGDWYRSTPAQIRRAFTPKAMRQLGGFSDNEYWTHCDQGGHPSPRGQYLLRFGIHAAAEGDAFITATMWGDLAQHLRRVWAATFELLAAQHARFVDVRAEAISAVEEVERRWIKADPLAEPITATRLDKLQREQGSAS